MTREEKIRKCLNENEVIRNKRIGDIESFWKIKFKHYQPIIGEMLTVLNNYHREYSINFSEDSIALENGTWKFVMFNIIIHYPEETIRNSKGDTHTIKDLFINLRICKYASGDKFCLTLTGGLRTTFTPEEFSCGFIQSHIHPLTDVFSTRALHTKFSSFKSICLGSSELRMSYIAFNSENNVDTFELLLHSLDAFIKWESLDGGPYWRIENIRYRSKDVVSIDNSSEQDSYLADTIKHERFPSLIREYIQLDNYGLPAVYEDLTLLRELVEISPSLLHSAIDANGSEIFTPMTSENVIEYIGDKFDDKPLIYFNAKPIYFRLCLENEEDNNNDNIFSPSKFKNLKIRTEYEIIKKCCEVRG